VHYQADPIRTVETNVLGMRNALALARRTGARVVQASTSEVYGDPLVHPQREDDRGNVSCFGPRACYDEGKRCAEALCFDFRHTHGVDARVARIFNTYGPRMAEDDGRVVSNFIVQALRGEPLTIYGAGDQTRSFCYVSDLVDGLARLMEAPSIEEPVNLGNPAERTVLELAERVLRHVGGTSHVVFRPLPKDDPTRRRPDILRAREWLGFEPTVDIDEGIARTVRCFAERMSGRRAA
jgi:UDP-glucuronate decarboxylase